MVPDGQRRMGGVEPESESALGIVRDAPGKVRVWKAYCPRMAIDCTVMSVNPTGFSQIGAGLIRSWQAIETPLRTQAFSLVCNRGVILKTGSVPSKNGNDACGPA